VIEEVSKQQSVPGADVKGGRSEAGHKHCEFTKSDAATDQASCQKCHYHRKQRSEVI
jgi:hypothetical protein